MKKYVEENKLQDRVIVPNDGEILKLQINFEIKLLFNKYENNIYIIDGYFYYFLIGIINFFFICLINILFFNIDVIK